jgi:hypothetical protein
MFDLLARRCFTNINPEASSSVLLNSCLKVRILSHLNLFGFAAYLNKGSSLIEFPMSPRLVPLESLVIYV